MPPHTQQQFKCTDQDTVAVVGGNVPALALLENQIQLFIDKIPLTVNLLQYLASSVQCNVASVIGRRKRYNGRHFLSLTKLHVGRGFI